MTRDKTATDSKPGAESGTSAADSPSRASASTTKVKPNANADVKAEVEPEVEVEAEVKVESEAEPDVDAEAEAEVDAEAEAKVKPSAAEGSASLHWLTRVAERAGLAGERPSVPPEVEAKEAWRVVTRAYKIEDPRLCELVAAYFRLDVADFTTRDPKAALLVPEALARRHHVYPLYETDRHLLVATCDPLKWKRSVR